MDVRVVGSEQGGGRWELESLWEEHPDSAGPITHAKLGDRGRGFGRGSTPPMPEQVWQPVRHEGEASPGLDVGGYPGGVSGSSR